MAFAVIEEGGKQHKVAEGDTVTIETPQGEYGEGDTYTFQNVLLTNDGSNTAVGSPYLEKAKVEGKFVEIGRSPKLPVIRFRSKSRYFRNRGHRQPYAKVEITKVG